MRTRVTFSKLESMRFTGHLDLYKTWERTIRRARLPLAYTQGFNPRPRINLAAALPLGFTGGHEIMDIWLEKDVPLDKITNRLNLSLPPGLTLYDVEEIDLKEPSLQTQLVASDYFVRITDPIFNLDHLIEDLLNKGEIWRERRRKTYNLRPLIIEMYALPDENNQQRIYMQLSTSEGANGRPDEVTSELGFSSQSVRIHRDKLVFA
jgi:radical SAM-linked protein